MNLLFRMNLQEVNMNLLFRMNLLVVLTTNLLFHTNHQKMLKMNLMDPNTLKLLTIEFANRLLNFQTMIMLKKCINLFSQKHLLVVQKQRRLYEHIDKNEFHII